MHDTLHPFLKCRRLEFIYDHYNSVNGSLICAPADWFSPDSRYPDNLIMNIWKSFRDKCGLGLPPAESHALKCNPAVHCWCVRQVYESNCVIRFKVWNFVVVSHNISIFWSLYLKHTCCLHTIDFHSFILFSSSLHSTLLQVVLHQKGHFLSSELLRNSSRSKGSLWKYQTAPLRNKIWRPYIAAVSYLKDFTSEKASSSTVSECLQSWCRPRTIMTYLE